MNPFEYLNSINLTKKDIMVDDIAEKGYSPWMVNRGLSYFQDTVLMANEMNMNAHLDNRLQYDFLRHLVRKKKRFSKWAKPDHEKSLAIIQEYYGYSIEKAQQVVDLISAEDLKNMEKALFKGGK